MLTSANLLPAESARRKQSLKEEAIEIGYSYRVY
jgi:hypothetical protein